MDVEFGLRTERCGAWVQGHSRKVGKEKVLHRRLGVAKRLRIEQLAMNGLAPGSGDSWIGNARRFVQP